MPPSSARRVAAPALHALVLVSLLAMLLHWIDAEQAQPPVVLGWDDASYFLKAQTLHPRQVAGEWLGMLGDLRRMSFVPPAHALAASLWFHVTAATPYRLSLLTLLAFLAGAYLSFAIFARHAGLWAGLGVLALFLSAPLYGALAGRPMTEAFGVLLTLGFVALYFPADARPLGPRRRAAAGAVLTLALFTKYNYGLYIVLTLLVHHGVELWQARREGRWEETWRELKPVRTMLLVSVIVPLPLWCAVIGPRGMTAIRRFFRNAPNTEYPITDLRYWLFYVRTFPET
jgi:hypothetical protein